MTIYLQIIGLFTEFKGIFFDVTWKIGQDFNETEIPIFTSKLLNFNSEMEKINDPGSRKVQSRKLPLKNLWFQSVCGKPESCNYKIPIKGAYYGYLV